MSFNFLTKLSSQFLSQFKKISKYNRILITGALGQIGSELVHNLNEIQGENNVLCTDVKDTTELPFTNKYLVLDITDKKKVDEMFKNFKPDLVLHNAAILSAMGEKNHQLALDVNVNGFRHIIDACTQYNSALFMPSSIASYGPDTPKVETKELSLQNPRSIYGCTKVFNELVGSYYHYKFGLDFRSIRYPIVISSGTSIHGSAAFCVHIYFDAIKQKKYECYIQENQRLPFIYITDLISGTLQLIYADKKKLSLQTYNMTSTSFTPQEQAESIKKVIPNFQITYKIDNLRQNVVKTWPNSVDDSLAKKEWGYSPQFDLDAITLDMLDKVKVKLNV